ncbi:hypothetical protein L1N85_13800 [Paenibacillus alkaliterrae]|uniref:hypothetical protein n=1 Tax=Paenibacillus alkaliterrae TaxID=320909 RepID=UPI001F17FEE3|nr:hypothetical protein [Paenibacillus alkaliterrae]MCF2939494.1 hypothetical protein [Paenibacillus alkaliterrae]
MELQLELLPYHYNNTLGFDAELIDYIDHVDDSIVFEKIAPLSSLSTFRTKVSAEAERHRRRVHEGTAAGFDRGRGK